MNGVVPLADLLPLSRWVAWQTEMRQPGKPPTKVPYAPNGRKAMADKPATWGTYADAEARAALLPKPFGLGGVGLELGDIADGRSIGGLDLDTCRSNDGVFSLWALEIIARLGSYTEVSPSKTGAKVYFTYVTADLPTIRAAMDSAHGKQFKHGGGEHPPAIELHIGHRYFAWTGEHLADTPGELHQVPLDTLLWLIREAGPAFVAEDPAGTKTKSASGQFGGCDDTAEPTGDLLARIEAATARWPMLARRWAGHWTGLEDQSRSGRAMSLCAVLKRAGFSQFEMAEALALHPDTKEWAAGATARDLDRMFDKAGAGTKRKTKQPNVDAADDDGLVTEGSVADAFTRGHHGALRYCHHTGAWFLWSGAIWKKEETRLAYRWAHRLARDLAKDTENAKAIVQAGKASFAAGVERIAQSDRAFAVTGEIWNTDPSLLGTPGGTVDLRTGELRAARQADHITKQTAVAPAKRADCPLWLGFLDQATAGDTALVGFVRRWFGYCLTGITREHALLFVYGDGGNGKGVCLLTMAGIMGGYAVNAAMDTFTVTRSDKHPTDMAMLAGARLVMTTEVDEGQVWAEARLKSLTGGDPITARFMRRDFFTFMPEFKLTISGNHKPSLRNVDAAAKRRFNLAPFTNKPAAPDRKLAERLKDEWPGILRWMLDGCLEWQRDGLQQPAVVKAATEEYFEAQDIIGRWLEERCTLHPSMQMKPGMLLADCRQWTAENGEPVPTPSQFRGAIERTRGVRYIKLDGLQWVKGVGLKPPRPQRGENEGEEVEER